MSPIIHGRASELGTILMDGSTGFTVRKRTGVGLIVHFFLLACMIILGASLLVYYQSPEGCFLAVAIGLCFAFVAQNLERLKKVKQALEFMNALFSSALGKGYQFVFIVKNTGDVVFYNRPFQAVFPTYVGTKDRTLETLLATYQMPQEHQEKLKALMSANTEGMITTVLREQSASSGLSVTLYVEPIERPTGFFIIRGK